MSEKEKDDKFDENKEPELEPIEDSELDNVTGGTLNPPRVPISNYDDTVKGKI
jgi:hypothetical protein